MIIIICKETFLKACGSLRSGTASARVNSKTNHVDNELICKTMCSKILYFNPKISRISQKYV